MDVQTELAHIKREYSGFFDKCELHVGSLALSLPSTDDFYSKMLRKRADLPHLVVKQRGEQEVKVTVDVSGWYAISSEKVQKRYETFEAFMMARSEVFQKRFGAELTSRLDVLVDDRFSDRFAEESL